MRSGKERVRERAAVCRDSCNTEDEKSAIRRQISLVFVEYGRLKGILESKGKKIETPHSVLVTMDTKDFAGSYVFEIDGLNENQFKENFRQGGFIDEYLNKWAPRKDAETGRAILVKSGRLKRGIAVKTNCVNYRPHDHQRPRMEERKTRRPFLNRIQ